MIKYDTIYVSFKTPKTVLHNADYVYVVKLYSIGKRIEQLWKSDVYRGFQLYIRFDF